jgi:plasmid stabilization system protein ParE
MTSLLSWQQNKHMNIVWTDAAKTDLMDLRDFLKKTDSLQLADKITNEVRDEVATLKAWPKFKGTYVKELEDLNLSQYRQLLAGQNRIIFERVGNDTCYIHLVCHTSRDLEAVLRRRLLSAEE